MYNKVKVILLIRRAQRLPQVIRIIRRMRNMNLSPISAKEMSHSLSRMSM